MNQALMISGLPCCNKGKLTTWIQAILCGLGLPSRSLRWGDAARESMSREPSISRIRDPWERTRRFTTEIESVHPLRVAETFVELARKQLLEGEILIVDGPKNRTQVEFVAHELAIQPVQIWATTGERERQMRVSVRKEPDDDYDFERDRLLRSIGLHGLAKHADVIIDTSGTFHSYHNTDLAVHLTPKVIEGLSVAVSLLAEREVSPLAVYHLLRNHFHWFERESGGTFWVSRYVLAA